MPNLLLLSTRHSPCLLPQLPQHLQQCHQQTVPLHMAVLRWACRYSTRTCACVQHCNQSNMPQLACQRCKQIWTPAILLATISSPTVGILQSLKLLRRLFASTGAYKFCHTDSSMRQKSTLKPAKPVLEAKSYFFPVMCAPCKAALCLFEIKAFFRCAVHGRS